MAPKQRASNMHLFICISVSFMLPVVNDAVRVPLYYRDNGRNEESGLRLTREYHLRQGALRGLIVKPSRQYSLQNVEMFLGIPYAAAPVGTLRFMPPVNAPPWSGVKRAIRFGPVCPQSIPAFKKSNPPSLGRQMYMKRLLPFLTNESEDCLYLNIYVPYRENKSKKFPVLVFIHGDSFEWSSGNPYDGRILSSYGNIMVVTVNYRLGILGFMKPSMTDHDYGNNGLLDQLAALKWIKDNIEDLNGDPSSVTLMGHGTGAACVSLLMLSPIANDLFHRAILMSGSALSDWAMTKDPTQYTLQVAQSLGCNPTTKNLMQCLQSKPLSEIKRVQILAREFETPLGPFVAGFFIPTEPSKMMLSYPDLMSKYQLLSGVTELERYHDFGVIELEHGILENQRDDFIIKFTKKILEGAEESVLKEVLNEYAPSKLDPQRWSVESNRDIILDAFSDARTLHSLINFIKYQAKMNPQSYFYVFGHNSVSTEYAPLNKSVHGEEMPYVLGVPLGGLNTHFHSEYTLSEKLLSECVMRLWTNFVKMGTPNTQSVNEYQTLDRKHWNQYNVDWPEYDVKHQSYLRLDLPPHISSLYRSNYTEFWSGLPNKMKKFLIDPLFEYTPKSEVVTTRPSKPKPTHKTIIIDSFGRRIGSSGSHVDSGPRNNLPTYGRIVPYSPPIHKPDKEMIYREIQKSIKAPSRPVPPGLMEKAVVYTTTIRPKANNAIVKTSSATITLIVSLTVLFFAVNTAICSILYFKKRKLRLRETAFETTRHFRPEIGDVDVIGQKSAKDDKSAIKSFKNGCNVIKSMSINKIGGKTKKGKKKSEICKTPKSDDSGGFRQRFELRRHLSTSTIDAHTKVRDWITNEVMHRCSPSILRKSNSDLNTDKNLSIAKPYTRSEELLSDQKKLKSHLKIDSNLKSKTLQSSTSNKTKTSEKTTSTSALGSHSSINSTKHKHMKKSNDSLKSKGTDSIKSKKVSVAIDATPSARTNSILKQEPIESYKLLDCNEFQDQENKQVSRDNSQTKYDIIEVKPENHETKEKTFTNEVTLSLKRDKPLKISHKHSSSDPVSDVNYELLRRELASGSHIINIPPPITFRNDINVTSRDESIKVEPLTAAESILTIQKRNFPKVLPDLPKAQKRLSLQPTSLQSFRGDMGSFESQSDRPKLPPKPPPRIATLDRRLDFKNSKPMSSFTSSGSNPLAKADSQICLYENMEAYSDTSSLMSKSFERSPCDSDKSDSVIISLTDNYRDYPKVIIASSNIPHSTEQHILIKPSLKQPELPENVPRVRLPDDFHSRSGSVTSFSSFFSDYEDDEIENDFLDEISEDKLIKALIGGVESPTQMDEYFDTKGPDTFFDKKLEIVPVKINPGQIIPKSQEDYVCISDLNLPDVSSLAETAKIKPNFGLNKLQHRSESIHKPPEKTVKVKQKRTVKPSSILNKRNRNSKVSGNSKTDTSKLKHSNSASSNDTVTSTGTVKEVKKK